jgi:hypothetical protein
MGKKFSSRPAAWASLNSDSVELSPNRILRIEENSIVLGFVEDTPGPL